LTLNTTVTSTGPLPSSGFPVDYQVSSPLVATVSPTGVITGLGVGKTRIWANAWPVTTNVIATVSGPGLNVNIISADTTTGTVTQSSQGYSLSCSFIWSAAATGSGVALWGKWEISLDGVTFHNSGYNGFRAPSVAAGQTVVGLGDTESGPFTATATPWYVIMRFHYGLNASSSDLYPGIATDVWVDRKMVCAP
jgi:hypothetical protein